MMGTQSVPAKALQLSRKKSRQKFKQMMAERCNLGDATLNAMELDHIPTVVELMDSPLAKFIHLAANDCGYNGSTKDLICN